MSMRKCDTCHEVAWRDTMSSDGTEWWCQPCMDEAYRRAGSLRVAGVGGQAMSTRTWTIWEVERLDDGTHVAMCGKCDWQRTVKSMSGGKRSADHHYRVSHRETASTEGSK